MQNLPTPETYEKEYEYMPWGKLIGEVEALVTRIVPQQGTVLDLLCGTGYLLGRLKAERPDIEYIGVDLEAAYIAFAQAQHPDIHWIVADASVWDPQTQFDVIVCTGGVHHLPYEKQEPFIEKIATLIGDDGIAIIADPYIADYMNETGRKLAAAELGYEYLRVVTENNASEDVIQATSQLIDNDIQGIEFKTSIAKIEPIFAKHFARVEMHKIWPSYDSEYGDYYFVLRK